VPLLTNGFKSSQQRLQHFGDHGGDFGAADALHYEALADAFVGGKPPRHTLQSQRPWDDSWIRYNPLTNEFGVLSKDGYIRTYFKPTSTGPKGHRLPRDLDYYFANSVMKL
jgi:filamentous hemagglutinin